MNILISMNEATSKLFPVVLALFLVQVIAFLVIGLIATKFPIVSAILTCMVNIIMLIFKLLIIVFAVCCVVSLLFWSNVL